MTLAAFFNSLRARRGLLLRYAVSGVCGALVQTSTLYVWVSLLGLRSTYLLGAVVAFFLALGITFLLQKFWTFRDHTTHRTHEQLFWYSVVAVVNIVINVVLLALAKEIFASLGIEFFHLWYLIVQVAVVVFASGVSFVLNYFFTFRNATRPIEESLGSSPLV